MFYCCGDDGTLLKSNIIIAHLLEDHSQAVDRVSAAWITLYLICPAIKSSHIEFQSKWIIMKSLGMHLHYGLAYIQQLQRATLILKWKYVKCNHDL